MNRCLLKLIPLLLISSATLMSCSSYTSKADTKDKFVGLFELDVYKSKHESSDEEPYDRKAEEGIVAYFTINSDGYGYYGYKDNNSTARLDQLFWTFVNDDEKPELFKAVTMKGTDKQIYAWENKVGSLLEPTMGLHYSNKETTLSYTIPWFEYTIYNPHKIQKYQYVSYKKISDETGYDAINKRLGTSFSFDRPYEMKYMRKGYYPYRCEAKDGSGIDSRGIYEYALLDMNNYHDGKLNIIYSLKSEPGQKTSEVNVSVKEIGSNVKFVFNDIEFASNSSAFITEFNEESDIKSQSFTSIYSEYLSLAEVIALETAI